jgi:hypothetical protein
MLTFDYSRVNNEVSGWKGLQAIAMLCSSVFDRIWFNWSPQVFPASKNEHLFIIKNVNWDIFPKNLMATHAALIPNLLPIPAIESIMLQHNLPQKLIIEKHLGKNNCRN